jgi:hypothetical protein
LKCDVFLLAGVLLTDRRRVLRKDWKSHLFVCVADPCLQGDAIQADKAFYVRIQEPVF